MRQNEKQGFKTGHAARWMLLVLLLVPGVLRAQVGFDVASVESYISDHKTQRSLLLVRSTLEYGNNLLHDYSRDQVSDYKELNVELDKYTRSFEIIDAIYQSIRLVVNVKNTGTQIGVRLGQYKDLLEDFNEKVLKRNRIELADTALITINRKAVRKIGTECESLLKSVNDLVLYATGAASCSTPKLVFILENINLSLDRLRYYVNDAYFATWRFVQMRIGFWKEKVNRAQGRVEIISTAYQRWRKAGLDTRVR